TPGAKRMRVMLQFNAYVTDPCASYTYGEVEDYTINVLPVAGRDAAITSLISPTNLVIGPNAVTARVTNLAADPISSVDLGYQLNANPVVSQTGFNFSPPIAPGASMDVLFTTPLTISAPGTYNLKVWLSNANGLGND